MTATVSTSVAGNWINGAAVVTTGGLHQVINPATGGVVAEIALAISADVDVAVAAVRAALRGWATATPADRSAVLAKLAQLAAEHADELVAEEVSQTGKPVRLAAEFDVPGSIDNIDFFAGAARHLEGKATAEYSADHTSSIRREAVLNDVIAWTSPFSRNSKSSAVRLRTGRPSLSMTETSTRTTFVPLRNVGGRGWF